MEGKFYVGSDATFLMNGLGTRLYTPMKSLGEIFMLCVLPTNTPRFVQPHTLLVIIVILSHLDV